MLSWLCSLKETVWQLHTEHHALGLTQGLLKHVEGVCAIQANTALFDVRNLNILGLDWPWGNLGISSLQEPKDDYIILLDIRTELTAVKMKILFLPWDYFSRVWVKRKKSRPPWLLPQYMKLSCRMKLSVTFRFMDRQCGCIPEVWDERIYWSKWSLHSPILVGRTKLLFPKQWHAGF